MGEIADALRRADPLDPPRVKPPRHEDAPIRSSGSPASSRPEPEPARDQESQVEIPQESLDRAPYRLLGDGSHEARPGRICLDEPRGHVAQQYRRVALRLRDMARSRRARSIVITSAQAGDGKTTTACNLAISLAMTDHKSRIALVDLDLHRASVAFALGIQVDISVDAVLRGEFTVEQATRETDVDGLCILAASGPTKEPDQLLAHGSLSAMIAELQSRFDWVIIDTPPILATSDTQVILQHADTALLVVRTGVSQLHAIQRALGHLPTDKILASFLNSSRTRNEEYGSYDAYYRDSDDPEATDEPNVERG